MDISMLINPLKRVNNNILTDSDFKNKYKKENESSSNDCQIVSENIPIIENNDKAPILPPSLNMKEKMKILQEWVNSIPVDSSWDICDNSSRSNSLTIKSDEYTKPLNGSTNISNSEILNDNRQSKKLFTSNETQLIVQLFCHHFKQGTLPSITEVRRVIQSESVCLSRTPESVRAKIKRLQSTGDWANFMGKNEYTL